MRIIYTDFLNNPNKPGTSGTSSTIWAMARAAQEIGHQVSIVAPYTTTKYPVSGIDVVRFSVPKVLYRNAIARTLLALIGARIVSRMDNIEIIHCRDHISSTTLLLTSVKDRLVFTSPGNIFERIAHSNPHDWFSTWLFRHYEVFTARRCPIIVATSSDMAEWWGRIGATEDRLRIVPLAIDNDFFRRLPGARQALCWDRNREQILFVGRLSIEKGVPDLISAVCSLLRDDQAVKLHLVGDGPLRDQLEKKVQLEGLQEIVIFHGWQDRAKLPLFYSAADVCILPSLSEPFGRVVLEAMSCGSVFVGSNVGATRDHVRHGENGYKFDPGDSAALTGVLHQIISADGDEIEAICNSATQYIDSHMTWQQIIKRLEEEVYNPLIHGA